MAAPATSAVNGTMLRILFLMRTPPLAFVFAPPRRAALVSVRKGCASTRGRRDCRRLRATTPRAAGLSRVIVTREREVLTFSVIRPALVASYGRCG
jgi:hypothetical protein